MTNFEFEYRQQLSKEEQIDSQITSLLHANASSKAFREYFLSLIPQIHEDIDKGLYYLPVISVTDGIIQRETQFALLSGYNPGVPGNLEIDNILIRIKRTRANNISLISSTINIGSVLATKDKDPAFRSDIPTITLAGHSSHEIQRFVRTMLQNNVELETLIRHIGNMPSELDTQSVADAFQNLIFQGKFSEEMKLFNVSGNFFQQFQFSNISDKFHSDITQPDNFYEDTTKSDHLI